ncbi:MAG: 2-deoxy-D-gluconate 3-dehydrogenase [Rhizorhabdus sp.]|nr:2-deoxy-D-gluconate 3-dehydrogenase [Rhizorhabdus sp.]
MALNLFDLTGKVALVTGGNSGLGLAFARGLAKAGADVVIWGRRADRNAEAVAELSQYGGRRSARAVDVASEADVTAGIQAAVEEMGRIDTLVINAGVATVAPLIQMTSESYHELVDVNLHGVFYTLREGAKHMVARSEAGDRGGSIVMCGSLAIFRGIPGMAHYNAAKGGVNGLGKNAAVELGKYDIRCNTIAPGLIATDLGAGADNEMAKMAAERTAQKAPLGRVGKPSDLEGIIVYLASDLSAYHTGDTITIDGGQMSSVF